ncbi:cell cycle checkpoint protein RAD17-like [Morone saxatilis]|uniref:cell cycle checkpoint protein RAD17-like n=1 Tax=Morone saxatilis TaxID=34816 RepID=UPI0015E2198E|nr:cell cycle checkpoint protein RAD17-like [Morone saxatilis]
MTLEKEMDEILWDGERRLSTERDRERPNRLVKRARSVLDCPLDSIEEVGEKRVLAKLTSIMHSPSHALHETDFPNQFYRQPGSLHDILRRFVKTSRCPLVFIVSDSLSGDSSSRVLFPREIQEELDISNISFNPVAPTTMMKVLTRISTLEAGKVKGSISDGQKYEQ